MKNKDIFIFLILLETIAFSNSIFIDLFNQTKAFELKITQLKSV
jgi:hypothetical protein